MQESTASATALRVAIRRAEHQIIDIPVVFRDELSVRIIGAEAAADIRPGVISRRQRLSPSFRSFMAARSRYAEDELARAVAAGVRQYVVLGAGLDTFAYRNPHAAAGLKVFEVDHPATQAWKRVRLEEAGIEIPPHAMLVALDFERQCLADVLQAAGFSRDRPAFFAWLGVTMYLTEPAFDKTLSFVASMPAGSGIVFDYSVPSYLLNPIQLMAFEALAFRVKNLGEPFQLFLDPSDLKPQLADLGFTDVEDMGREELNARYFAGRTDELRVRGTLARLVRARI